MSEEANYLTHVKELLESKSTAKQTTYKHLLAAFSTLALQAKQLVTELKLIARPEDKDVTVDFKTINVHEFHVKLAGDMLIFVLHTNVVTLEPEHPVIKDPYMAENASNKYFGQINVYNFMADSLLFNRINDPGYLLVRLMINHENRFFAEGDEPLGAYAAISKNPLNEADLMNIVRISLTSAIENDLMAPPFTQVRFITLFQKLEHTPELGGGQKIGFRMSYENKVEG